MVWKEALDDSRFGAWMPPTSCVILLVSMKCQTAMRPPPPWRPWNSHSLTFPAGRVEHVPACEPTHPVAVGEGFKAEGAALVQSLVDNGHHRGS